MDHACQMMKLHKIIHRGPLLCMDLGYPFKCLTIHFTCMFMSATYFKIDDNSKVHMHLKLGKN